MKKFEKLIKVMKEDDFNDKMKLVLKMGFDLKATYYLNSWLYFGNGKNLKKYSKRIDEIRGIL